jgi:hypothetical protein
MQLFNRPRVLVQDTLSLFGESLTIWLPAKSVRRKKNGTVAFTFTVHSMCDEQGHGKGGMQVVAKDVIFHYMAFFITEVISAIGSE